MPNRVIEVLPKDKYAVLNRHKLTEIDRKVVHLLYQPLIGVTSVSLYFALLDELNADQMWSKPNDHYWLLDFFALAMPELLVYRKTLEGIGLLRTFQKKNETSDHFIYEIQAPLSAETFFKDEILMVFLRQKLGERHVDRLQKIFSDKKVPADYLEITQDFNQTFVSVVPDATVAGKNSAALGLLLEKKTFFTNEETRYKNQFMIAFDFPLLVETLRGNFVNRKSLTPLVMDTIATLAFLYQINVVDMSKLVLRCCHENGVIDTDQLKVAARESYLLSYGKPPNILAKMQPLEHRTIVNPQTDEERLLYDFENNSPLDLLTSEQVSKGAKPSAANLETVENVMINQKLNPGVVNVLIHYVLQKSDNKIPKNYVEEIAATLARKKIMTVQEAYDHFKNGQVSTAKTPVKSNRRTAGSKRKDIIPSWMKGKSEAAPADKESPEELQEVEKMLEKFKKGGKSQ